MLNLADNRVALAAALFSGAMALPVLVWKRGSFQNRCFVAGMIMLAAESALRVLGSAESQKQELYRHLTDLAAAILPGIWLCFGVTYSRGNYREFLSRWKHLIFMAFMLPLVVALSWVAEAIPLFSNTEPGSWLSLPGALKAWNIVLLLISVLILMNLEATSRAAVGTMRWRIKFVVLGLSVIFGARIYSQTQALLFSGSSVALTGIDAVGLLVGCVLIAIGYLRSGFAEIDVYPSHAVLHSSVTILLVGGYLFVVGALAQIISLVGGAANLQMQALLVLLAMAFLAVLMLSDRARQQVHQFVSRHFKRPQHDFRQVWTMFSQRFSSCVDHAGVCSEASRIISETFSVLSVTIWSVEEGKPELVFGGSTIAISKGGEDSDPEAGVSGTIVRGLQGLSEPFDLEGSASDAATCLKKISTRQFPKNGGPRICIPLVAGDQLLGLAVVADRVNGIPYTVEEFDLMKCIGDQVAAHLLSLRLTEELMQAKELEAFQAMSAFFVHDLKNAASSLSLTLQNLPVHFDDPAFREDALRGIGKTVDRIRHLISRLSALRNSVDLKPVESDLNAIVSEALNRMNGALDAKLVTDLRPVPNVAADREQIQSVVTNLLLNARDALSAGGSITVGTSQHDGRVVLSVADDGCGMTPEFLRNSLFRPFHSTKKKGLGIGMFQSKRIIEAHHGAIQVESQPGKGTVFRVSLPIERSSEQNQP